jgi:PAS domain S-box-containing protein
MTQRNEPWFDEPELLRALIDRVPVLAGYFNPDLRIRTANAPYAAWFGLTPDKMRGKHASELLYDEAFQASKPHMERALTGEEQDFTRNVLDSSGRPRRVRVRYVPDVVDDVVQGFFSLVTDQTEAVEAQQELDESQLLANIGNWSYYPHTGEIRWSRELYRLFGADPETDEPTFETWSRYVHPDDVEVRQKLQEAIDTMSDSDLRYRLLFPDGTVRHMHSLSTAKRSEAGRVVSLSGTVQDETDMALATDELRRTNLGLERANQLLTDMIAMVGHDVRQPLQSVTGFLEFALEAWQGAPPEQVEDSVRRALSAGRRMHSLLDGITTLVNVDTGTLEVRRRDVSLGAELAPIVAATPASLELIEDAVVDVDPFHLQQVVANLISNAERYGEPPIEVIVDIAGGRGRVTVSDQGEGVPESFVPELFDKFRRAASGVAARQRGTGFGLYIASELVRANDGTLEYAAGEPRGARFILSLPLCPGEEKADD